MGMDFGTVAGYGFVVADDKDVLKKFMDSLDSNFGADEAEDLLNGFMADSTQLKKEFPHITFATAGDHWSGETFSVAFAASTAVDTTYHRGRIMQHDPTEEEKAELDRLSSYGLAEDKPDWCSFEVCS